MEAIGNIEEDTSGITFDDFMSDRRRRDAVIRTFEVIGGAIKNLPQDLKERFPNTDWRKIAGFRDVLTYVYFGIKPTSLWDTAKNELPGLKKEIRYILLIETKNE